MRPRDVVGMVHHVLQIWASLGSEGEKLASTFSKFFAGMARMPKRFVKGL